MTSEVAETNITTLGNFLRTSRQERGLDMETIARETRISMSNLRAIEEDDFTNLPPDAFTRGFYRLYANILSLNPEEIIKRYDSEKLNHPEASFDPEPHYKRRDHNVGVLAERSTAMPVSSFGLIIFLLLSFGAFLCWYFSWNPATFLSQKLRGFQQTPSTIEQVRGRGSIPDELSRLLGLLPLGTARAADNEQISYNDALQIVIVKAAPTGNGLNRSQPPSSPPAPTH